ncbi:aldehyde dehydrogenase family protein [Microbacterium immunditiarum]|uniref:Acyl-CoA reductase-like NAD-dependent aldehyde dehydrogenase n=1 Tax=Microbacterium immunditiarum TaxID=337480 RepID=A0A7Y9KKK3_9MICO|nr:aldehyde dehydrogenase family protein [Microbacterium immunditiarum]NYE19268.1 acyl-CoA reductase-like NAD-dependent aldehyde dehydrogenase [Microbacterium immunditiarum]
MTMTRVAQLEVRDPGRFDEVAGVIAVASPGEIDRAAREADAAALPWAAVGADARAEALLAAARDFDEVDGAVAELLTRENGSVLPVSRREVSLVPHLLRMAVDLGLEALAEPADDGTGISLRRRPYGVVACIVPWNAPVVLALQKVGPALVAGNTVIVKPSPNAPLAVTRILERIGARLPDGVLSVVNGAGEVGSALVAHPAVRKVSFTGGEAVARQIMTLAAESFTRVHFELGGNDPAIVLDDADVGAAAEAIVSHAFRRSGQVCYAIKRVYVPRRLLDDFSDAAFAAMDRFVVGHGLDPDATMGPVNNAAQFERVRRLHDGLRERGARVETGGVRLDPEGWERGWYLQPSLVRDADPLDEVVTGEQFGPILPVVGYDEETDAVAEANGTEYGLCASVWSADLDRARAVAERLEAGITFINEHALSPAGRRALPFGGVKRSGIGWEGASAGIDEYLQFHGIQAAEAAR